MKASGEELEKPIDKTWYYKARIGIRRADGYQRMEEMTIMKMKCTELRDFIANGIGLGPVQIA